MSNLIFIFLKEFDLAAQYSSAEKSKQQILSVLGCISVNTEIRTLEQEDHDR